MTSEQNPTESEVDDLRESAKEMGVEDADERDPDEVVEEVRKVQADSETSPSEWREKGEDQDRGTSAT